MGNDDKECGIRVGTALETRKIEQTFHGVARHGNVERARYTCRYGFDPAGVGASPSHYSRRMEVKTMTVLGIASLVILLLEFATRVIELFLVIRSALLTRRGKERHK